MKIISILRRLSTARAADLFDLEERTRWLRDPLTHPDVEMMTERELADLPFNRNACSADHQRAGF